MEGSRGYEIKIFELRLWKTKGHPNSHNLHDVADITLTYFITFLGKSTFPEIYQKLNNLGLDVPVAMTFAKLLRLS